MDPFAVSANQLRAQPGVLLILIWAHPKGEYPDWRARTTPDGLTDKDAPNKDKVPLFSPANSLTFGAVIDASFFEDQDPLTSAEADKGLRDSQLFQLAPFQDVFPVADEGVAGAWKSYCDIRRGQGGGLSFGRAFDVGDDTEAGGVTLRFDEKLKYGTFEHNVHSKGTFSPSLALGKRRGNQRVEFEIGNIAVLSLEAKISRIIHPHVPIDLSGKRSSFASWFV